jgi:co-chaperonin GroES (HSP10)
MRVLRDKVLIKPETEKKISDIIELPDDTKAKPPARGVVLAIGPDVSELAVGDTVHFEGFDWTAAPEDCIVIAECEVLAREL